ncbi:MAG: OmpA family protein, partial [Pseudomonadota bacterium]
QRGRIAYAFNATDANFDQQLMGKLLTEMQASERLSYTFRFLSGSVNVDEQSSVFVNELAASMVDGDLGTASIKLAGFADARGPFSANLNLSRSRAEAVKNLVIAASNGALDDERIVVEGYGELAPVACNETNEGQTLNRRVEVWAPKTEAGPQG